jgi:hypothetical protein
MIKKKNFSLPNPVLFDMPNPIYLRKNKSTSENESKLGKLKK